jgi:hypothetical protein
MTVGNTTVTILWNGRQRLLLYIRRPPALAEGLLTRLSLWTLSYSILIAAALRPARLRLAQFIEVDRLNKGRTTSASFSSYNIT